MKALSVLAAISLSLSVVTSYAESNTVSHADGTKTVSRIDSNNNPLETSEYRADGTLSKRTLYERDHEGRLLRTTVQKADGRTKRVEINSYDSKGHLSVTRRTNEDGSVWVRQYSHDPQGNQIGSRATNAEGKEVSAEEWDRVD